jgi:aspartate/methionine/tyrosine aminotransferase
MAATAESVAPVVAESRDIQAFHPFIKLNRLLADVHAGPSPAHDGAPVKLQIGEPQNAPPALIGEAIAAAGADWNRYPPPRGSADYRTACTDWLAWRFGPHAVPVDPETQLLPLPGTREGLFFAALASVTPERDTILMPNPFYHVYAGAAVAAGARPVFVPATAATGFQPDYSALDRETLDRTALAFLNSPSNPQGSVAGLDGLRAAIALARRHDFAIALDECYSEIHDGTAPPGALQAAAALGGGLENMLVFHSLSKRSSAPGLRCGFVAGDARWLDPLDAALRVGGAGVPLPVLAAGAALWRDEDHVAANRRLYAANFAAARRVLGPLQGDVTPQAGFFLWLDVGDSEAAAVKLWREAGIRVLPGAYMSVPDARGANPGGRYIRVALVHAPETTEAALRRLAEVLSAELARAAA